MLQMVVPERHRQRFKNSPTSEKRGKLGNCPICEERVRKKHEYLTTSEGYTHRKCLREWKKGDRNA